MSFQFYFISFYFYSCTHRDFQMHRCNGKVFGYYRLFVCSWVLYISIFVEESSSLSPYFSLCPERVRKQLIIRDRTKVLSSRYSNISHKSRANKHADTCFHSNKSYYAHSGRQQWKLHQTQNITFTAFAFSSNLLSTLSLSLYTHSSSVFNNTLANQRSLAAAAKLTRYPRSNINLRR